MTLRSFIIGIVGLLAVTLLIMHTEHLPALTLPTGGNHLPAIVVFVVIVLTLGVNPVLRLLAPKQVLSQGEILTVWCMMAAGVVIPSFGLMHYMLPFMVAPFYYAGTGSRWDTFFYEHIPKWLVPSKDTNSEIVTMFFEGHAEKAIPWRAWIIPFFGWGIMLGAFFLMVFCIVAIVRKQWVEHERLSFPLAQIPIEITRDPEQGHYFNALFRSPLMWIGAAIPIAFVGMRVANHFWPQFPFINQTNWSLHGLFYTMPGWNGFFSVSFIAIGVAYLLSTDVSFSLWFFFIIANVQAIMRNRMGYPGNDYAVHQQIGSYIIFFALAIYTMRKHLGDVFRKAFLGDPNVDDSEEGMSYRFAVFGLLIAMSVLVGWLWVVGAPPHVSLLFIFIAVVVMVGLSRLVAQCGLIFVQTSAPPLNFVQDFLGDAAITPSGLTAITFQQAAVLGDPREIMMPSLFNNMKLAEKRINLRKLFWAMLFAVAIAYPVSYFTQVGAFYRHGVGADKYAMEIYPRSSLDRLATAIESPKPALGLGFDGIKHMLVGGGAFMAVHFMRANFYWWPLHPVGILTARSFPMSNLWLMTFIGWLCKALSQKYAKGLMMKKIKLLFLGLIIGEVSIRMIVTIIEIYLQRKIA